ncbi:MAG TPA: pitrilysin family protein [Symbiobacteriaceae bacterium]|nr:pitrilysin family protein [Symbiobacteriaceae bacterium]
MEKHYDPLLKDTLFTEKLPNGLTVSVLHKPGYKSATGRAATHYGSIDAQFVDPNTGKEVHVPDGIAHFLEHKLFEKEWGNVSDRYSEFGAESNAYTTYTHTEYHFNTTQNFAECFDLLLDFVQNPWFTDESVAKEQGIIEQEIRMYLDDPGWRSNANLLEAMYVNHPVKIDIAGTVESIHKITKETLYLCHSTFYHPSNMVVFVAGDVDPDQVLSMVKASYGKKNYKPQAEIKRILPEEPPKVLEKRREQKLVVNQPLFRMGFKDHPTGLTGSDLLKQDLTTAVILDAICGRSTELYTRLYEAGLIDHRFGFEYNPEHTYGFSQFAGPTRDPDELEKRLLEGIEAARQKGLSEADFERAKKKTIGRLVSIMNDLDGAAYMYIDGFFKGIGLFDLIPTAQGLTLEAANQRLQAHFDPARAAVSVIVPK